MIKNVHIIGEYDNDETWIGRISIICVGVGEDKWTNGCIDEDEVSFLKYVVLGFKSWAQTNVLEQKKFCKSQL